MTTGITLARRITGVLLAILLFGLLGIVGFMQVAERTGHPVFVIRGHSMEPSISFGSVVVNDVVSPEAIRPGDVLSIRAQNGVVFTHRVVEVLESAEGLTFRTQGDANDTADPVPTPASGIIGRTAFYVPLIGIIMALLSVPSGILSLLSMLGALLLLFWLLEDLEREASLWAAAARPPVSPWMAAQ